MRLLGIDLGTSGTKAILVDGDGRVRASATAEHPIAHPRPGWAEQEPSDWWRSTVAAVQAVLAADPEARQDVGAIGLAGQMHGLVALDARGAVIRPCILWNDQRSAAICDRVERDLGLEHLLAATGNRMLPGFTAPKILWMRDEEPDLFARAATWLLPKDWLRYRLSGTLATEVSDASGTLLFDCARRRWSEELIAALGLDPRTLPACGESPERSGRLSAEAAEALGLSAGIPIVGGAGDQAAQAIGAGIVDEGAVSVTIGTSGVVFAASRAWRRSARGELHAFCHAAPGRWHVMGVMLAAGGSLRWYRDALVPELADAARRDGVDPYERIVAEAEEAQPGAEGLLFLPYLSGERCPHPDPLIRGAFVGLDARHRRSHLARATLEGITFGLADNLDLVRALGIAPTTLLLSGGGARSRLWRRLCADVFRLPIETRGADEGAALGAALLAGVGVGVWTDVPTAARAATQGRPAETTNPDREAPELRRARRRFRALYPILAPFFSGDMTP